MSLRISGISRAQFEQRLAQAIEAVSGNPVRKISRIRRAMTVLFHGGTGPGQNEHTLEQFFPDAAVQAEEEGTDGCVLVQLKTYELALTTDIMELCDVETYVCATTAAYEQKLADLFRQNFPDSDRILHEVMESSLVEGWVDDRVDAHGSNESVMWQMLSDFDHAGMQEWLLQTFGAEHLMLETAFFSDVLCMNQRSVSVEATELLR
jgi:hypothetical protein